jgi:hypothetical protein
LIRTPPQTPSGKPQDVAVKGLVFQSATVREADLERAPAAAGTADDEDPVGCREAVGGLPKGDANSAATPTGLMQIRRSDARRFRS